MTTRTTINVACLVDGMTTGGRPTMTASLLKIISLRLRGRRLVKGGVGACRAGARSGW